MGPNNDRHSLGPLSALSCPLIGVVVGVGAVAWGIDKVVVGGAGGGDVDSGGGGSSMMVAVVAVCG